MLDVTAAERLKAGKIVGSDSFKHSSSENLDHIKRVGIEDMTVILFHFPLEV